MEINYTAIDWLTCTSDREQVGLAWYDLFKAKANEENLEPFVNQSWSNGYYSGLSIDHLKWGRNDTLGYILIASGDTAHWVWPLVKPAGTRITRIDLCADVLYKNPLPLARSAFGALSDRDKQKRRYSLFQGTDKGSTLYVGSRHSQAYGRLYDKGVESKLAEPERLWRYEVEIKKPLSQGVCEAMWEKTGDLLEIYIKEYIGGWFSDRGIESAKAVSTGRVKPVLVQRRTNTPTKKLTWLRTQVAPSVAQLVEAGYGREVVNALFWQVKQYGTSGFEVD